MCDNVYNVLRAMKHWCNETLLCRLWDLLLGIICDISLSLVYDTLVCLYICYCV